MNYFHCKPMRISIAGFLLFAFCCVVCAGESRGIASWYGEPHRGRLMANGKKFIFHLVPSGIMNPVKTCVVGNGVVFDAEQFLKEVDELLASVDDDIQR